MASGSQVCPTNPFVPLWKGTRVLTGVREQTERPKEPGGWYVYPSMRFLPCLLSAAAVLAACAGQQPPPPEAPPPSALDVAESPVETFSLAFSTTQVDICSQSVSFYSHQGKVALRLLRGARAELVLEGTSFDSYASRVDDHAGQSRTRDYAIWVGEVRRDNGAILIKLAPKGERCEALPLYGDERDVPGVAQSCSGFFMEEGETIALRCAPGAVKVSRRPDRASVEAPEDVEERPAMRCRPARELPYPLSQLVFEGDLSFPLDPGIRFSLTLDLGFGDARFEFEEQEPVPLVRSPTKVERRLAERR